MSPYSLDHIMVSLSLRTLYCITERTPHKRTRVGFSLVPLPYAVNEHLKLKARTRVRDLSAL